jgi:hypothetical protein
MSLYFGTFPKFSESILLLFVSPENYGLALATAGYVIPKFVTAFWGLSINYAQNAGPSGTRLARRGKPTPGLVVTFSFNVSCLPSDNGCQAGTTWTSPLASNLNNAFQNIISQLAVPPCANDPNPDSCLTNLASGQCKAGSSISYVQNYIAQLVYCNGNPYNPVVDCNPGANMTAANLTAITIIQNSTCLITGGGAASTSGGGGGMAFVGAGIGAGIVVIAIIVFIVYRRRKRNATGSSGKVLLLCR